RSDPLRGDGRLRAGRRHRGRDAGSRSAEARCRGRRIPGRPPVVARRLRDALARSAGSAGSAMPGVRGAVMHGSILRALVRSLVPALVATVIGLPLAAPACAAVTNTDSELADSVLADAEWRAIKGTIGEQLAALK